MKIIRKIIAITFLFILLLIQSAYALHPTSTWTGLGADNKASTPANWSGNVAPQSGEGVVFDATSSKNCTWDMTITLAACSITSGYTGKITLEANLTISDDFIWTGLGQDNLASNPDNWSKNAVPEDGYRVVFNGRSSKDCDWNISVSPSSFSMETAYTGAVTLNTAVSLSEYLNISGGTLNLTGHDLTSNGYLLIAQGATLNASTSTITVKGDWLNAGTFNCGQSTVVLSGTGQSIYGNNAFYNLVKTVTSSDTLYFQAGSTQAISNSLTLTGTQDSLLSLYSTVPDTYWFINPQGAVNLSFARIKDMNNNNPVNIVPLNSIDEGHNDDVSFGGSECVCIENGITLSILSKYGRGTC